MSRALVFNRPARKRWSRPRHYRVCINDMPIYAKVFTARSPRHALVQASLDIERNRDWRADWDIIGGAVTIDPNPTRVTSVEEVQP